MGVYWRNHDNDMWLLGHAIHVKRVGGEMRSIWRFWALALLALAVQSWATCTTSNTYMYATGSSTCSDGLCIINATEYYDNYRCDGGYIQAPAHSCGNSSAIRVNYACRGGAGTPYFAKAVYTHCQSWGNFLYYDRTICTTKCEADSAAHYSSCVSQANHFWDSDSCKCRQRSEADSVFTVCTEDVRNGTPYYQIYVVNVHYKDGAVESACGVSPNLINGEGYKQYCALKRSGNGTCANAGVPNGPSEPKPCNGDCSKAGQEMLPSAECYAVVGYSCYLRDLQSGNTFRCECDGSCSKAMTDLIRPFGEGSNCRNPYKDPNSSPSSSDSGNSSDSGGSSPSSGTSSSPSSGTSGMDYTDLLNQLIANTQGVMNNTGDISEWTQTTMNNTTDIKNEVSNIGIDVGNIRDNTAATKDNTYNIANQMNDLFNQFVNYVGNQNQNQHAINSSLDSIRNSNKSVNGHVQSMDGKLTQTNSLLDSLTKKEWGVSVNVAGDTNIINVSTDTSKAPAEIKGILETFKGAFDDFVSTFNEIFNGDDSYDATDTAGTGTREKDLKDSINAKVGGDTVPNMRDSIPKAITGVRGSLGALRDSLNGSAYGDSMNVWTDKLLNNGVLSGNGSNNCPQFLTRNFSWNMGPLGTWNLGSFRYICEPIAGVNITLWALARMVLRAMVAITCMLWLYRVVVGIDGGNNEEN